MTEFKDAVEKQRGLQAYEEWAKQLKQHYYDKFIAIDEFNDGSKTFTDIRTGEVTQEPRKQRRRELIDSFPFRWFLNTRKEEDSK
jgi:type IV secretory pathway VirD2 relaxase